MLKEGRKNDSQLCILYACLQSIWIFYHSYDMAHVEQRKGRSKVSCGTRRLILTWSHSVYKDFTIRFQWQILWCILRLQRRQRKPDSATWGRFLRACFRGIRLPTGSTCCPMRCSVCFGTRNTWVFVLWSNLHNCIQSCHWVTMGCSLAFRILKHNTTDYKTKVLKAAISREWSGRPICNHSPERLWFIPVTQT